MLNGVRLIRAGHSTEQINAKEVELQESRLTSERTMVQMMELTNEVNTKQDEVGFQPLRFDSCRGGGLVAMVMATSGFPRSASLAALP